MLFRSAPALAAAAAPPGGSALTVAQASRWCGFFSPPNPGEIGNAARQVPKKARMIVSKLLTVGLLQDYGEECRRHGRTVVWSNGCFDLLHLRHVRSLQAARALGDRLVVGLNNDGSVRQIKRNRRPMLPAEQRRGKRKEARLLSPSFLRNEKIGQ